MKLEIRKSEVFKEVEKRSSLEASVHPDNFEQVWASAYEGGFLDTYWIEGYTSVVQLFKRYLRNETVAHELASYDADEVLTITAEMPARYNALLTGSIITDIKMMIAAHVLAGWLSVLAPDRASQYETESKDYASDLRQKLLYRDEPCGCFSERDIPDDVEIATPGCGCEEMVRKANDRLILKQYEECDHRFESCGNHGRRHQCGSCDRP